MAGGCPMSTMRQAAEDYLTLRRAIGFKLEKPGRLVLQFADPLAQLGAKEIPIDIAVDWGRQRAQADRAWWAYRLSAVRGFTVYLHPGMPGIEVPPADLMPLRTKRATPYLYSSQDIEALMTAARGLRSPMAAATYETLIGLMAVTSMRLRGTVQLQRSRNELQRGPPC